MTEKQPKRPFQQRLEKTVDEIIGTELEKARGLVREMFREGVSLEAFTESAIDFWKERLCVDRIFICDIRDGAIVAGWQKGKNIARLSDWDPNYVPLEDDRTLQRALESDALIAAPRRGARARISPSRSVSPMAGFWLAVMDQTDAARYFSHSDMAFIRLVRDLIILKARLTRAE